MGRVVSSLIQSAFVHKLGARVSFGTPLWPYVSYRVGGPADILVFPKNISDLEAVDELAMGHGLTVTLIGQGSNVLVRDEGVRGIVLMMGEFEKKIQIHRRASEGCVVEVTASTLKQELLEWAISHGLSGLEFSTGIPGTVGGGIFMNAGTKYGSYGDILTSLSVYEFGGGGRKTFQREEISFSYREQDVIKNSAVVSATFQLKEGNVAKMRETVNSILSERAAKQPLHLPSCGSTFKNPPGYSAGRLIEASGLKGLRVGGAEISLKHANFILNVEKAKAKDILDLIDIIKETVKEKFQIALECEVIILGDEKPIPRESA